MQEEKREWGEGVNVEAADGFLGRLQEARRRILGGTPCASEFFPAGALSVTVDTLAAVGQIVRDARRGVRGLSC